MLCIYLENELLHLGENVLKTDDKNTGETYSNCDFHNQANGSRIYSGFEWRYKSMLINENEKTYEKINVNEKTLHFSGKNSLFWISCHFLVA